MVITAFGGSFPNTVSRSLILSYMCLIVDEDSNYSFNHPMPCRLADGGSATPAASDPDNPVEVFRNLPDGLHISVNDPDGSSSPQRGSRQDGVSHRCDPEDLCPAVSSFTTIAANKRGWAAHNAQPVLCGTVADLELFHGLLLLLSPST